MREIVKRHKQYVEVVSNTSEEGIITPLLIVWEDGRKFSIDKIIDRRRAHSLKTGGTGIRYTVIVGGQATYLFFENPRWFVEAKETILPD